MKQLKFITTLLVIIGTLCSCKNDMKKDHTDDMVQDKKLDYTEKFMDLTTKNSDSINPSYCKNQVFKATDTSKNGYNKNGEYFLTFNLPSDSIDIDGDGDKEFLEPKYVNSYTLQNGEHPIELELWQHELKFYKPLCSLKTKKEPIKRKFKNYLNSSKSGEGFVIIYHDQKFLEEPVSIQNSKINKLRERIKKEYKMKKITQLTQVDLIEIIEEILKPQTIGGGVIPPSKP